jgi:hypothetical protein
MNPDNGISVKTFRCYLVAHSMGGLVCRAFLQNPGLGDDQARGCVDKVFTYATPHNGIELLGLKATYFLRLRDSHFFNHKNMSRYLHIKDLYKNKTPNRIDWLPQTAFSSERFFCMIGTNRADYPVATRHVTGEGSDGLVKIENASIRGLDAGGDELSPPCPTAYTYRSHSGYFGIVNSEESYQNLTRFLFGDIRVDIWADIHSFTPPFDTNPGDIKPEQVKALYQIELSASPRSERLYLTRRRAEDDSAGHCDTNDLINFTKVITNEQMQSLYQHKNRVFSSESIFQSKAVYLSSIFLFSDKDSQSKKQGDHSIAFIANLGVPNPDYDIVDRERRVVGRISSKHFEGVYLYQDSVIIEITPSTYGLETWNVKYDWQSKKKCEATTEPLGEPQDMRGWLKQIDDNAKMELRIPFGSTTTPGIKGDLRFVVSKWNTNQ